MVDWPSPVILACQDKCATVCYLCCLSGDLQVPPREWSVHQNHMPGAPADWSQWPTTSSIASLGATASTTLLPTLWVQCCTVNIQIPHQWFALWNALFLMLYPQVVTNHCESNVVLWISKSHISGLLFHGLWNALSLVLYSQADVMIHNKKPLLIPETQRALYIETCNFKEPSFHSDTLWVCITVWLPYFISVQFSPEMVAWKKEAWSWH